MKALMFVFLLLSTEAVAQEIANLKGKIVVMALLDEPDADQLVRMVKAIQEKLASSRQVELLPAEQASKLLGGPGFIGRQTESFERLRGYYQQGYLQNYNFEYPQAVRSLQKVLSGLKNVPDEPARWDLYVLANIYLGMAYQGQKDLPAAIRAYQAILRTRPEMQLSKKDYPPQVRKVWRSAKQDLSKLRYGKLMVDTDPQEAQVMVDGVNFGNTPLEARLAHGGYHVTVRLPKVGNVSRWVKIGRKPVQMRLKMRFESALAFDLDHPAVRVPKGHETLPAKWWPWLGSRLGVAYMATVRKKIEGKSIRWKVSLVDLERSRVVREGWLELSGLETEQMSSDAADLADFLVTGKADKRVVSDQLKRATRTESRKPAKAKPDRKKPVMTGRAKKPGDKQSLPVTKRVSSSLKKKRPLSRTWWPYALGGAGGLVFGLVADATSNKYEEDSAGVRGNQDVADTWHGIAIASYVAAGLATATGVVLHLTYKGTSTKQREKSALVPSVRPGQVGLVWMGMF